jgi:hypothetical protein
MQDFCRNSDIISEVKVSHAKSWCEAVRQAEALWIDAIIAADARLPMEIRPFLNLSLAKQNLSHLIRRELIQSGLPVVAQPSGNSDVDYFVLKGTAVIRVKGLNKQGRPSNYATDTALQYHLGDAVDSLPDLPPLPRVDVSYHLDEVLFVVRAVELLEWRENRAVRRYQLPAFGMPREIEVAEELPFEVAPATIRPKREEMNRRRRARREGES